MRETASSGRSSAVSSVRRKLAIASWSAPKEGNIYGTLRVDATQAQRYIAHLRETTGSRVSITHLVGKAVGLGLAKASGLNGRILWGRYIPHQTVAAAFLVSTEDGRNLAKVKIDGLDRVSCREICETLRAGASRLHKGEDEEFNKSQGPIKLLPSWLLRPVVWLTGWITGSLGFGARPLGLEAYPFGAAVITSVGMLGLDEGFVPPTPFARVPIYILIGAIRDQPMAIEGEVCIRPQLTLTATLDHRFVDGFQAATLTRGVRHLLTHPWELDGLDAPPWESTASEAEGVKSD
jgi:pyruvate/2-oxoglutarate dehydrogenase complex dihydrolipoamide acyltransferase (E2) component